jgi:hypothetical protein
MTAAFNRGVKAESMTEEQRQELMTLIRDMSAADLSILQAVLEELGSERPIMVTTTPGSNNDVLWSKMVALGWMSAAEPLDVPVQTKVFVIEPTAKEPISTLLADNQRSEAMTKIINDLRADIPPRLIAEVHRVDGTPAHLAIMLAGIVESTMRRAIKPHLHDEFLREVLKVAEGMRSI